MARRGDLPLTATTSPTSSAGAAWTTTNTVSLIVALVGLAGVITTLYINGRRAERLRLRELYANGYAAVMAYKEFAFAIRRRDHTAPASERVRLSDALSAVQRDVAYYQAFIGQRTTTIRGRPTAIATAYLQLVTATRTIAGGILRDSWNQSAITADAQMHAPAIAQELQTLQAHEQHYLACITHDLKAWWQPRRRPTAPASIQRAARPPSPARIRPLTVSSVVLAFLLTRAPSRRQRDLDQPPT